MATRSRKKRKMKSDASIAKTRTASSTEPKRRAWRAHKSNASRSSAAPLNVDKTASAAPALKRPSHTCPKELTPSHVAPYRPAEHTHCATAAHDAAVALFAHTDEEGQSASTAHRIAAVPLAMRTSTRPLGSTPYAGSVAS